jgi:hypothetical protein
MSVPRRYRDRTTHPKHRHRRGGVAAIAVTELPAGVPSPAFDRAVGHERASEVPSDRNVSRARHSCHRRRRAFRPAFDRPIYDNEAGLVPRADTRRVLVIVASSAGASTRASSRASGRAAPLSVAGTGPRGARPACARCGFADRPRAIVRTVSPSHLARSVRATRRRPLVAACLGTADGPCGTGDACLRGAHARGRAGRAEAKLLARIDGASGVVRVSDVRSGASVVGVAPRLSPRFRLRRCIRGGGVERRRSVDDRVSRWRAAVLRGRSRVPLTPVPTV